VTTIEDVRELVQARSPLPSDDTQRVLATRFARMPRRLGFALERWPLAESAVLDVGCSMGQCLVHFGPGSLGVDNAAPHVAFCRALGLDALQLDVERGLDAVPDAAFDYAWVSDIVEHLDAPRLLLRRVAPKLRPDGRLLLFLTTLPRSRVVRAALRRRHLNPFDAQAHHYQFTYETARYLVEQAGYRIEAVEVPPYRAAAGAGRVVRAHAPRIFLEARRDEETERAVLVAERKNKQG
jgi:SAM-dependent methyltransferase